MPTCRMCGLDINRYSRRPQRYCSGACRQKAYRRRKKMGGYELVRYAVQRGP